MIPEPKHYVMRMLTLAIRYTLLKQGAQLDLGALEFVSSKTVT